MHASWLQAVIREAQLAADSATGTPTTACDLVAQLATSIEPPLERIEYLIAVHFLQRAAWEALQAGVQCGVITQAAAYSHYRHIVDTTEHTAWADIPTRVREREAPTGGDPLAVRIREYLDSHSLEKITLDSLAGAVGCSVRTATAAFRRAYGISVHIYLIRRRLAEAARLLVTTHMKVSAVAESVGFQDQTALYRHFRQVLGSTPTQVRKKPQSAELMATQLWIRRDQKRGA